MISLDDESENVSITNEELPDDSLELRSKVWILFRKVETKAHCRNCSKIYNIKGGNTSTPLRHAQKKHKAEFKAADKIIEERAKQEKKNKKEQFSISNYLKRKDAYSLNSDKRKRLNHKLVKWIVKDNQPLSVAEKPDFREFMAEADPKYVIPARKTISQQLIPDLYRDVDEKLVAELEAQEFIAFDEKF